MKHVVFGRRKLQADALRGVQLEVNVRSRSTSPLMALIDDDTSEYTGRFESDVAHAAIKIPVKHAATKSSARAGISKKVRGSTTANKAILSNCNTDDTDEESSKLRLGGIWKDLYVRLHSLEETCKQQEEIIGFITEDRDSLFNGRCEALNKFKQNAQELSSTALSHLEAKEIIKIIKHEKDIVDNKLTALESQREWLEKEIKNYKSIIASKDSMIVANNVTIGELSQSVEDQLEENKVLQDIVYNRDETIENVKNKLVNKEEEIEVLRRSIAAKEKQFAALLKDRERIRTEFDSLKKQPIYIRIQNNKNIMTPSKSENRNPAIYSPAAVTDLEVTTPECVKEDIDINNLLSCSSLLQSSSPSFNIKERQYLSIIKRLQDQLRDKCSVPEEPTKSTPVVGMPKRVACQNENNGLNQVSKVLFKERESVTKSSSPSRDKGTNRGSPNKSTSKSSTKTINCIENNVIKVEITERKPFNDVQQPHSSPCPSPSAGKSPTRLALRRLRENM